MIYIVNFKVVHGKTYHKVGWCEGDIDRRISMLQVGNPFKLELYRLIPGTWELEQTFHDVHRHICIRGEWYPGKGHAAAFWLTRRSRTTTPPDIRWVGKGRQFKAKIPSSNRGISTEH